VSFLCGRHSLSFKLLDRFILNSVLHFYKGLDDMMIYLLTTVGLTPGGSSTVQYTFTHTKIYRTTQLQNLVGTLSGIRNQSG
jgi:hypothetical protein